MRVVVVGATGNSGTSVLEALGREDRVTSILGLARRLPAATFVKTEFARADVTRDDLVPHLDGADCVINLAWLIQPARDHETLWKTNVQGSSGVMAAVAAAGVPSLVVASSVGVYSAGPRTADGAKIPVDESWPREGIATSWYSRHKAEVERRLDRFEDEHEIRIVRLRPALIMKRGAAESVRRLFFGPFLPSAIVAPDRLALVPHIPGLLAQVVHSHDVGEAYARAVLGEVRGAFNLAAEPPLDGRRLAEALDARAVPIRASVARALAATTWRLRIQPTSPDWLDLALGAPLLDCTRARNELDWKPQHGPEETVKELLAGIATGASSGTEPLRGGGRIAEIRAGVGGKPL